MQELISLIPTLGFPIVICLALFWFIFQIYKKSEKREDELRAEIRENQEINKESIKTLALYAERLDLIQTDVNEIKQEITILAAK